MNSANDFETWLHDNAFDQQALNAPNPAGQHLLILAAQQGRDDVLQHVLQQGLDLSVTDSYGNNALWAACYAESLACLAMLLDAGIDINYQNPTGATALTYASSSGKHAMVAQLLQAGANPTLATDDDFTALDLAATRECLQLLRHAVKTWQ